VQPGGVAFPPQRGSTLGVPPRPRPNRMWAWAWRVPFEGRPTVGVSRRRAARRGIRAASPSNTPRLTRRCASQAGGAGSPCLAPGRGCNWLSRDVMVPGALSHARDRDKTPAPPRRLVLGRAPHITCTCASRLRDRSQPSSSTAPCWY
jgi:hypothetical protein